jgi:hypothetical protein
MFTKTAVAHHPQGLPGLRTENKGLAVTAMDFAGISTETFVKRDVGLESGKPAVYRRRYVREDHVRVLLYTSKNITFER